MRSGVSSGEMAFSATAGTPVASMPIVAQRPSGLAAGGTPAQPPPVTAPTHITLQCSTGGAGLKAHRTPGRPRLRAASLDKGAGCHSADPAPIHIENRCGCQPTRSGERPRRPRAGAPEVGSADGQATDLGKPGPLSRGIQQGGQALGILQSAPYARWRRIGSRPGGSRDPPEPRIWCSPPPTSRAGAAAAGSTRRPGAAGSTVSAAAGRTGGHACGARALRRRARPCSAGTESLRSDPRARSPEPRAQSPEP
jgi:hypothetical protein